MSRNRLKDNVWAHSRRVQALVMLLTVLILGGIILLACLYPRQRIRGQIAGRDAQIAKTLYALLLSHQAHNDFDGLNAVTENPADQFSAILEATELPPLKGVLATRLFDTNGILIVALPEFFSEAQLSAEELEMLRRLQPVSRFQAQARLVDFSETSSEFPSTQTRPLLEVAIPLHRPEQTQLLGIAQFVLEGESIAAEFNALDRNLFRQALLAFLGGGGIVVIVLALGFRELQKLNRLLLERTRSLLQANQELTWAAKSSAIGAVTAHLIHGLKNPLSGLQHFVTNRGTVSTSQSDTEWQLAVSTARRMQSLVNEVVRVLREDSVGAQYEISLEELVGMISVKVSPLAKQAAVEFRTELAAEGTLVNREANLILLVLENLVQNAIQATPQGRAVTLKLNRCEGRIDCEVQDEGPGLPEGYREFLFKPCQSTKERGSGIGLAISKQLANSLGAELELKSSSCHGCVFSLVLPRKIFVSRSQVQAEAASK